jgi:hypothetical protein
MVGKAIALIQVPNQRLFWASPAARYCGFDTDTLKKYTDEGLITAYDFRGRRVYRLEDLDRFIESLPKWKENGAGENPLSFPTKKKGA